jgi:malonyl-CoA/methylmalonyl-CoA synthetase
MPNLYHRLLGHDPDRAFIDTAEGHTAYGAIDLEARSLGAALVGLGLEPGDRLVAQTTKSLDGFTLWLACLAAGVVYVPTNTAYTHDELRYFCSDAGAKVIVTDPLAAIDLEGTRVVALEDLVATASEPIAVETTHDHTPAALVYTSGTTGRPKGATLTHGCLLDNARALAEVWQFAPDDVLVHALPIFHVHGLFIALNPAMLVGSRVRFLPRFDVDAVVGALDGATVFMGVPTYYRRLLDDARFGPERCTTMRLFTSGSAPMTEQTHAEFTERTGRHIVERYGMSEAGIITSNRIGDAVAGTVGHALPGYEVRIVDDGGEPVATGAAGVVEIRGPSLCAGYWGRPDADAASRNEHGWFSTGDIGSLDESGRLTLEGRSSDMIISGGLNVYPKEIEIALDAIDGVIESAVVGLPDPDLGEAVTAFVVLEPGFDLAAPAVVAALAPLARFKHPKALHTVEELPRNAMGKVQKTVLRASSV